MSATKESAVKHTPGGFTTEEYQYGKGAPHVLRKASREYRERNRDKINAKRRERYKRDREQGSNRFAKRLQSVEHKAGQKLRNAVFAGKITKPDRCGDCGQIGLVQGHHADYTKPLEVLWVCAACHGKRHRKRDFLIAAAPDMFKAICELECPDCGHTLEHHADKYNCDVERGDGYRIGSEILEALEPCGCECLDCLDLLPLIAVIKQAKGE